MKVAVIGAGFCGLAVVWNLLNQLFQPNLEVTLFDKTAIGSGASGVAAGLLHPYAGAHAKLNWRGKEAFAEALQLLYLASCHIKAPVFTQNLGGLRLATALKQQLDYQKSPALFDPNVAWLSEKQLQEMVHGCVHVPALWIKQGVTVHCKSYMKGLWSACQKKGAFFQKHHFHSLKELKNFSLIIVTAGALSNHLSELAHLPLKKVKGQMVEMSWPASLPPLPGALNSYGYIVMKPDGKSCLVGSSYEREALDSKVDIQAATKQIFPKTLSLVPALKNSQILKGYAGLRAVTKDHLPLISQVEKNCWALTGMGSKGLLYHALMAKELMHSIFL